MATVVLGVLAAGCASYELTAESTHQLVAGEMIVYRPGHRVPASELIDLGPPSALGGTVLAGEPVISARIDHSAPGFTAGVFQATRGKVLVHFPFTEHATILFGEVALTDELGTTHVFKPGDSYLIQQGSTILWDVRGALVQKSFFHRVEPHDTPGPMLVYRNGATADDDELMDLGEPASLGGTVLSEPVALAARVDLNRGGLLGGIFQATRGDVLIDFPFSEHATVTRGTVTLTDELGTTHIFHPGDSYLIKRSSQILWQVSIPKVQKSFLNFYDP